MKKRSIFFYIFIISLIAFVITIMAAVIAISNGKITDTTKLDTWATILFVFFMTALFSGIVSLILFIIKIIRNKRNETYNKFHF